MQSVSLLSFGRSVEDFLNSQTRFAFEDYRMRVFVLLQRIIDIFRVIGSSLTEFCGFYVAQSILLHTTQASQTDSSK